MATAKVTAVGGKVVAGRGVSPQHLDLEELAALTGERFAVGTLNVVLTGPLLLDPRKALRFAGNVRFLWPGRLNGEPVWLYRWRSAPLHTVEVLSPRRLRDHFALSDGSSVVVEAEGLSPPFLSWAVLWKGREDWPYAPSRYRYARLMESIGRKSGLGIVPSHRIPAALFDAIKRRFGWKEPYPFARMSVDDADREFRQVRNLLEYTKTGNTSYAALLHPAGYHTIEIAGRRLRGQRDPAARQAQVPLDFTGKSVLDLGSNQGGMLFPLAGRLKWGVGVDFDHRMVNAANRIAQVKGAANLGFFVLDLERENLQLIRDFLPEPRVDLCFLLSVCMWIRNWREVIDFAASVSGAILFESNGTERQQEEQLAYLSKVGSVRMLAESSEDDPGQKKRKLALVSPA